MAIAGVAGGFVSSTATVLTMADRAKADPTRTASAASAAIMSNVGTVIQLAVVVGSLSRRLLEHMAIPLIVAGVITVLAGFLASWRSYVTPGEDSPISEKHPFKPATVLQFVALLAAVMLVIAIIRSHLGNASLPWMMVLSGLADVHAAAAAVAQAAATHQIDMGRAMFCVAIAVVVNGIWKCAVAFVRGDHAYGFRVALALLCINGGFGFTIWLGA